MPNSWDKLAKKLLLNPHGREALKQFGIEVEIADPKKQENKPIVVVLCPTYRSPEPQMQDALGVMVRYTREKDFATVYSGPPCAASVVHWSRNWMLAEHLKSGKPWTHALFIDDDIVVEPDALERLLSHNKHIVAGLCTRRQDPPVPNIRLFDEETGKYRQIWEWPENQLIGDNKRIGAGTGLMLVSQWALEQIAQVYFDCLWEQETYGLSGDKLETMKKQRLATFDSDRLCYWFRFLQAPKNSVEMGEDVSFCHLATRYCDISVYVDTSVQPGHLGSYPFGIRDFLPYRAACVENSKGGGTKIEGDPAQSFHMTYETARA
jgi:hypothetical protein